MGPKPAVQQDTEMKFVNLKVVGGEPPSNAVLSAKLSPYGVVRILQLNLKKRTQKKQEKKLINKLKHSQTSDYILSFQFKPEKLKLLNYYHALLH